MKKRISYILLIVLLIFLKINIIDAAACKTSDNALVPKVGYCPQSSYGDVIVQVGGRKYLGAYTYWQYGRQFSHKNVYCVKNGDSQPVYKTCSVNNSLYSNSVRAAIGYIIANYNSDYAKAQYLIHRVLELFEGGQSVVDYSWYQSEYEAAAQQKYNYDNKVAGTYYLATLYSCGSGIQPISDGYTTEVITQRYTNTISHWTWGYVNDEGNNGDKRAFHLGDTTFEGGVEGNTFVMDDSRKVTIPNGFYLEQSFGTSAISGSWNGYSFDTTVTQRNFGMGFEYDYSPYNYSITYELNGGTNSSSNPSTYNVLYGVTFSNPTRTGYVFDGWYKDASFTTSITGINEGANASFNSAQDLYKKLNLRTTGDVTIYAKWTPDTYKVIYHGNGGYTSSGQNIITDSFKFYDYYTIKGGDLFSNTDHTFIGWTTDSNGETDDGYGWTGWSGAWTYTNGEYGISNKELHLYARWQDSCVYEFKNTYNNSPTTLDRLNLYKKYHRGAWNSESRRNLLDFRIHDAETACGNHTPVYSPEEKCLEANKVSNTTIGNFTYKNISDFNDTITGNSDSISYCLTNVEVNPNLSLKTPVKTGQLVLKASSTDVAVTGEVTKTCYIHKSDINNYNITKTAGDFGKFRNFFTNIKNGDKYYYSNGYSLNEKSLGQNIAILETAPNSSYKNRYYYINKNKLNNYKSYYHTRLGCYSMSYASASNSSFEAMDLETGINYCIPMYLYSGWYNKSAYNLFFKDKFNNYYATTLNRINNTFTRVQTGKYIYNKDLNSFYTYSANNELNNNFIQYSDYIDKINLDDKELNQISQENGAVTIEQKGDFYEFSGSVKVNYSLNPVYAEKITGKPMTETECFNADGSIKDSCRLLGYGVASKFNDANLTNPSFNFSITSPLNSIFSFNSNNLCTYTVDPEIIKYNNSEKGNVDLEFRIVDTNNPFNRTTKANWSDGTDSSSSNNVVQQYITDTTVNNSYNRTGSGSLYTNQTDGTKRIILTPDLVKSIREYNKTHSYDDYTIYTEDIDGVETTSTEFFDYLGLTKAS